METRSRDIRYAFFMIAAVLILACGGAPVITATETPAATFTPEATNTATPKPTRTPIPTRTPQPTPAPRGVPIQGDGFTYTIIDGVSLRRIYPGGEFLYIPDPGYIIIDLGVRLQNDNPGSEITLNWGDIYITEANGDAWLPLWGSSEEVASGTEMDPYTIGISSKIIEGTETTKFKGDLYLRLIFIAGDNNNNPVPIVFGIGYSNLAEFIVEQPK